MRKSWLLFFVVVVVVAALAEPALAQATNPYNVSWSALNPGNDWAAQVIQSLFPITGTVASPGTSPGQETTVIQQIVGQLTGFVRAIACAFVAYTTIMNIHRAAESARVLGQGQFRHARPHRERLRRALHRTVGPPPRRAPRAGSTGPAHSAGLHGRPAPRLAGRLARRQRSPGYLPPGAAERPVCAGPSRL